MRMGSRASRELAVIIALFRQVAAITNPPSIGPQASCGRATGVRKYTRGYRHNYDTHDRQARAKKSTGTTRPASSHMTVVVERGASSVESVVIDTESAMFASGKVCHHVGRVTGATELTSTPPPPRPPGLKAAASTTPVTGMIRYCNPSPIATGHAPEALGADRTH